MCVCGGGVPHLLGELEGRGPSVVAADEHGGLHRLYRSQKIGSIRAFGVEEEIQGVTRYSGRV